MVYLTTLPVAELCGVNWHDG